MKNETIEKILCFLTVTTVSFLVIIIGLKIEFRNLKSKAIKNNIGYYHPVTKEFILVTNAEPPVLIK